MPNQPDALDPAQLALVVGGAQVNTDQSKFRWRAQMVGDVPVVFPESTSKKTRTDFGQCVDNGFAQCESTGGGNAAVGQCKLAKIDACTQTNPMQP